MESDDGEEGFQNAGNKFHGLSLELIRDGETEKEARSIFGRRTGHADSRLRSHGVVEKGQRTDVAGMSPGYHSVRPAWHQVEE